MNLWDRRTVATATFRATYYTPEITTVKLQRYVPLNMHWTIPVKIRWKSDNPLEYTTDK